MKLKPFTNATISFGWMQQYRWLEFASFSFEFSLVRFRTIQFAFDVSLYFPWYLVAHNSIQPPRYVFIQSVQTLITSPGYCCFVFASFHPPSRHINTSPTPAICKLFRGVAVKPCEHFGSSWNVTIFSRGFIGCMVCSVWCCCCCGSGCCWCWCCWCWCCISCIGIIIVPVDRVCSLLNINDNNRKKKTNFQLQFEIGDERISNCK